MAVTNLANTDSVFEPRWGRDWNTFPAHFAADS